MTTCTTGLQACKARIIRVDVCGKPVIGPKSVVEFDGFVSVGRSPDYEEGEEMIQKNACGDLCINAKDCPRLKRINMDIQVCTIDPDVVEITTGNRLLVDASGDAKGWATGENVACDGGFSLEIWQKNGGGPDSACSTTGDPLWNYWSWPYITGGALGDMTFENGPFTFNVTGFTKPIATVDQWGTGNVGPFAVLPPTAAAVIGDHEIKWVTDVQPPASVCGAQPLAA